MREAEAGGSLNSRSVWSTEQVPIQLVKTIQRNTALKNKTKKPKETNINIARLLGMYPNGKVWDKSTYLDKELLYPCSFTECCRHCSAATKRHHDQGNSYKRKHLTGLTVSEAWSIIMAGSRRAGTVAET